MEIETNRIEDNKTLNPISSSSNPSNFLHNKELDEKPFDLFADLLPLTDLAENIYTVSVFNPRYLVLVYYFYILIITTYI